MNRIDLARIELEARRQRAQVLAGMIRSLFRRAPRVGGIGVRTA